MSGRSLWICGLLALAATAARADWEGDVEIKDAEQADSRGQGEAPKGKVRFKQGKLRMDIKMGPTLEMTTITDLSAGKVFLINHLAKEYSEMSDDAPGAGASEGLSCKTLRFSECMKENGFKKTGSETVNGQPSAIWEGATKEGQETHHQRIWHPDAAGDELAFVRTESRGKGGAVKRFDILNWKKARQDDARFKVPDGYRKSEVAIPGMRGPRDWRDSKNQPDDEQQLDDKQQPDEQ